MIDYLRMGNERLEGYVHVLTRALSDKTRSFDLIVGSGNTGVAMLYIAMCVVKRLRIEIPPVVALPLSRTHSIQINSFVQEFYIGAHNELWTKMPHLSVLFVDDEIYAGTTIAQVRFYIECIKKLRISYLSIIAEDQGFQWNTSLPNMNGDFLPYSHEVEGHQNTLFYFIPKRFDNPIKRVFPEDKVQWYSRINLLLDLPLKTIIDGKVIYSYELLKEAELKIPNLKKLQHEFATFLNDRIDTSLAQMSV